VTGMNTRLHEMYDNPLGRLSVGSLRSASREGREVSAFQALTHSRLKAEITGRVPCELALNLSNVPPWNDRVQRWIHTIYELLNYRVGNL